MLIAFEVEKTFPLLDFISSLDKEVSLDLKAFFTLHNAMCAESASDARNRLP